MSIRRLRRQGDQPQLLKNDCPNLPREDTGHQNMLDSLPDLITKSGMRQATLCKTIGRPASVVENKPNEEFAFQGSPTLPDSLPRSKPDSTNEEGLIG